MISNQKDFEIIMELRPLEVLFCELSDVKKQLYAEDLRDFSLKTIREAIQRIRKEWDRVSFPPIGVIVSKCRFLTGGDTANGISPQDGVMMWDRNSFEMRNLANNYRLDFMRTETFAEAQKGGYDAYLLRYVYEVSHLQARMIVSHKGKDYGVLWHIIQPLEVQESLNTWRNQFMKDCENQANTGQISVSIPVSKIREWEKIAKIKK